MSQVNAELEGMCKKLLEWMYDHYELADYAMLPRLGKEAEALLNRLKSERAGYHEYNAQRYGLQTTQAIAPRLDYKRMLAAVRTALALKKERKS